MLSLITISTYLHILLSTCTSVHVYVYIYHVLLCDASFANYVHTYIWSSMDSVVGVPALDLISE